MLYSKCDKYDTQQSAHRTLEISTYIHTKYIYQNFKHRLTIAFDWNRFSTIQFRIRCVFCMNCENWMCFGWWLSFSVCLLWLIITWWILLYFLVNVLFLLKFTLQKRMFHIAIGCFVLCSQPNPIVYDLNCLNDDDNEKKSVKCEENVILNEFCFCCWFVTIVECYCYCIECDSHFKSKWMKYVNRCSKQKNYTPNNVMTYTRQILHTISDFQTCSMSPILKKKIFFLLLFDCCC